MKTIISALALLLSGAAAVSAAVEVQWENPEKFTDATYRDMNTDKQRQIVLKEIQGYIETFAGQQIPEGYTLSLNVTDVDLEGDFEPARSPTMNDIRIVRTIYAPAMTFSYELRDEAGEVVKHGEARIRHNMLGGHTTLSSVHQYPYTREMLRDWFADTFRDLRS